MFMLNYGYPKSLNMDLHMPLTLNMDLKYGWFQTFIMDRAVLIMDLYGINHAWYVPYKVIRPRPPGFKD